MVIAVVLLSFLLTLAGLIVYRKLNLKNNFCTGIDINKKNLPIIPEGSGIMLLLGIWASLSYLYVSGNWTQNTLLIGLCATIFALIGFFDDTKNKFTKKPLGWTVRAIPIAIISFIFAHLFTSNPFHALIGALFIAGFASFQNTFAGLNGLEVGSGFILSIFTAALVYNTYLFFPAIALSAAIFALLLLNFYPAKVFPGDAGTLLIGSALGSIALASNDTKLQITIAFFFIPHVFDFLLKLFTNPKDMTQQKQPPYKLLENGLLAIPDLEKPKLDFAKFLISIFGPMNERKIVLMAWTIVFVNCLFWISVIS